MQLKCSQTEKGSKDIIKMWHQWFNYNFTKLREYCLYKENKNNDFIQQFFFKKISSSAIIKSTCVQRNERACFVVLSVIEEYVIQRTRIIE